ncbi:hypothetical protein TNIN_200881 [Trichonephila inaurata madagascariensis]|uniref:Uncharacterized protein n=1 Tax=Trichonephila inaurata madagascariensis TaxID=2747483 RepID=A0A8X6Y615_9ARAC|nr:hypothetical protein TNIN_200881 [Trichonephila inaurata madagascariensis]
MAIGSQRTTSHPTQWQLNDINNTMLRISRIRSPSVGVKADILCPLTTYAPSYAAIHKWIETTFNFYSQEIGIKGHHLHIFITCIYISPL